MALSMAPLVEIDPIYFTECKQVQALTLSRVVPDSVCQELLTFVSGGVPVRPPAWIKSSIASFVSRIQPNESALAESGCPRSLHYDHLKRGCLPSLVLSAYPMD